MEKEKKYIWLMIINNTYLHLAVGIMRVPDIFINTEHHLYLHTYVPYGIYLRYFCYPSCIYLTKIYLILSLYFSWGYLFPLSHWGGEAQKIGHRVPLDQWYGRDQSAVRTPLPLGNPAVRLVRYVMGRCVLVRGVLS